jgi:uncharacterized protein with PIN domain
MRLLCDEMLHRIGRWLRAAGYDTAIVSSGLRDREVIERCIAEGRILLTKDRQLASAAREAIRVVLLVGAGIDADARAIADALDLDWQHAPFTRCVIDNARLVPAAPKYEAHIPLNARASGGPVVVCPACGRIYWSGGHVRRMRRRLVSWQRKGRG